MTIHGSCLCGKVGYVVNGKLGSASHCHCSMCRRQHGAAFATYATCNPKDFRWTRGEALVKVFQSDAGWCFCQECGSTLAGTEQGRVTSITLGTVQGDPGIQPSHHIFVGSKAPWHPITDALPQFNERSPSGRAPAQKKDVPGLG